MEALEMNTEWENEPDSETGFFYGLPYLIKRNYKLLNLCGYVGVPPENKFFGKDTDELIFDVHGGISYSKDHKPLEKSDGYYWYGFDCAHCGDLIPAVNFFQNGIYRNIEFVRDELKKLAKQLQDYNREAKNDAKR